ncbi:hypothetical protein CQ017_17520 [Arthrobacter sp. MYb224]|nr:hypothetical protein CQ017_17520 [Arthrobacter sp. MYb224]
MELFLRSESCAVVQDTSIEPKADTLTIAAEPKRSVDDAAKKYIVDLRSLMRAREFVTSRRMDVYRPIADALYAEIREYISQLSKYERTRFNDQLATTHNLDVEWSRLQQKPNALAVLYNFSPYTDTGAVVASKRIRASGDSYDVIACSFAHRKKIDGTIERIAAPYVYSKFFLPMVPSWATWSAFKAYAIRASRMAQDKINAGSQYDYFYTRAMWAPSHYAGVLIKKQNPTLKWVAEFSDPLSLDVEGLPRGGAPLDDEFVRELTGPIEAEFGLISEEERTIFSLAEIIVYAHADEIVFTNDHQKSIMLSHIYSEKLKQRVAEKSTVSNHPTLPNEFYEAEVVDYEVDSNLVNLAYFGEFYATRGLTEVTTAIRMLPEKYRSMVHLHVFTNYIPVSGSGARPRGMSAQAYNDLVDRAISGVGAHGIEHQVTLNGSLPYLKFLGITKKFDYLLVNDARSGEHHSVNPYLPSKWSDYAGSESKSWAFVEDGSSLSLKPATVQTPLGDISAIAEGLIRIIEEKLGNK